MSNSVNGYNRFESISKIHDVHEEIANLDTPSGNEEEREALNAFETFSMYQLVINELERVIDSLPEGSDEVETLAAARETMIDITSGVALATEASIRDLIES